MATARVVMLDVSTLFEDAELSSRDQTNGTRLKYNLNFAIVRRVDYRFLTTESFTLWSATLLSIPLHEHIFLVILLRIPDLDVHFVSPVST